MSQRITILLEDDLTKKLRTLQAKLLKDSSGSVSFSQVINKCLRESLK